MGDPFRPTWQRCLLAVAVATAAFLLPQEAPLEWYPLNDPSDGLHYLEITCAANITGTTRIKYDIGSGFGPLHTITIPIAPSQQAFTYTFPLPDAPLRRLRLEPLDGAGELRITNFRIIERSGSEIYRFTRDSFQPDGGIATIDPISDGWKIRCAPNGQIPAASIMMGGPVIPRGMNDRNLQRCLLSWSYLAGMLWLLLLIAWLASFPPNRWKKTIPTAAFLALLGILFSVVGNRGLIQASIAAVRYVPPPTSSSLQLELDVTVNVQSGTELFWDRGNGFQAAQSAGQAYYPHSNLQVCRFPLPEGNAVLQGLRWDPLDRSGNLLVHGIRIIDSRGRTCLNLPLDSLIAGQQIAQLQMKQQSLEIQTAREANDPTTEFAPSAVTLIAHLIASRN